MSMGPGGSLILISSPVSAETATLVVDSISYTPTYEELDRIEWDNDKIKNAKLLCGQNRRIGTNLFTKPFQIVSDCDDLTAVPLGPNSDANFANITKKFTIKRYTVTGSMSENHDVELLYNIAKNHQGKLAKFAYYKKRVSGDAPYESLIAARSETFSYLTTTGVNITGSAMYMNESNVLITSMTAVTELAIPTNNIGGYEYYKTFNFVFETRTLETLDDIP